MIEKLRLDLLPVEFDDLALVALNGNTKYPNLDWKTNPLDREQCIASAKRHINDLRLGKLKDDESQLHPALHAAFRMLMIYYHDKLEADNSYVAFDPEDSVQALNQVPEGCAPCPPHRIEFPDCVFCKMKGGCNSAVHTKGT